MTKQYTPMKEIEEMAEVDCTIAIMYWARDRYNILLLSKERPKGEAS